MSETCRAESLEKDYVPGLYTHWYPNNAQWSGHQKQEDLGFASLKNDSIDQNDSISPSKSHLYFDRIITINAKRYSQAYVHDSHNLLSFSIKTSIKSNGYEANVIVIIFNILFFNGLNQVILCKNFRNNSIYYIECPPYTGISFQKL